MNTAMPQMEDGVFYDLAPPAVVGGKTFHRVRCEYQVPNHPHEYVVRGVPEGGSEETSFVLRFSPQGKVQPTRSQNQDPVLKLINPQG